MRRALTLFAALLGGSSAVQGQSSTLVEESITITATAVEEKVREVPSTVDVLDREAILERKADQAIDLLRTLAGIDIAQSGSRGKVASIFTRGTNSSHTLVLWNGVELNDPFLGGFDASTLALDGVERLEVARGPFSALYGGSALGGVVQLVTRAAAGSRAFGARAEAGSNDLLRGGANAAFPVGLVDLDLAAALREGEGEVDNDFYDADEIDLGVDVALGDAARLGALLRSVGSEVGVPYDFFHTASPHRVQRLDATSLAVPFSWTGRAVAVELLAAETKSDLEFRDGDDPFAASDTDARRDQGRATARFPIGSALTATLGGDWERQQASNTDAFGTEIDDVEQEEWSAFAQLSWSDGPVRVDGGVRRDDNDAFGAETSLRLAAAWQLSEGLRLRGAYGEAFRAPSLADLYYPFFGNPELEPELVRSYELALEGEAAAVGWSIALFENDLENLIEFDSATFLPQNIGRARARGAEGSLAVRRSIVDARLAVTWLDGENLETGGELLRRPEEKASLVCFVRPGSWSIGAVARYVGDRLDFGDVPLDAYSTLDLSLAFRFEERWEPFVRLENVFDEVYEEVAGFPAPGTAWTAGIDIRF